MSNELRQKLYNIQQEERKWFQLQKYEGVALGSKFVKCKSRIENLDVRDEDVWVTGFPRSGITWTQEMVWLIANNLDYDGANISLDERYTLIEFGGIASPSLWEMHDFPDPIAVVNRITGRRFILTYLPWKLLPLQIRDGTKKPKIVYVLRQVKDVCVSYFQYHNVFMDEKPIDLEQFFNLFISDNYMYSPYWDHVLGYWKNRQRSNLLILKYEAMVQNLPSTIRKVAAFFDTTVLDNEMDRLVCHLVSMLMWQNEVANKEYLIESIKRGNLDLHSAISTTNSNKEQLTDEMIQLFDLWTELNTADTDFSYDF